MKLKLFFRKIAIILLIISCVGFYSPLAGQALTQGTDVTVPVVNEVVQAFAFDSTNNILYLAGSFTDVDGQVRNQVAAYNTQTNEVLDFNPDVNGEVVAMILSGSTLYISGSFTTVGGVTRNRVAAIDVTTGLVTSFNPDVNHTVSTIVLSGSTLYMGGFFTAVGGASRSKFAGINVTTGLVTDINPSVSGTVQTLLVSGTTLYVGGFFNTIGGVLRNNLAAVDIVTGLVTDFNPDVDGNVAVIEVNGTNLYIGGNFGDVGGATRANFAVINTQTGNVTDVVLNIYDGSGVYYSFYKYKQALLVGGIFYEVGGAARNGFAAINLTNHQVMSFNPDLVVVDYDNYFNAIISANSNLYFGGGFITPDEDYYYLKALKFPHISFSTANYVVSEASTSTPTAITVSLEEAGSSDVAFTVNTSGTAIKDTDYTLDNTSFTIPAGQTTKTIYFTPIDNYKDETNKLANLILSSNDAFISDTNGTSTITITDNDTFGTTLTDNSMIVHQNQTTGIYKTVLNSQPTADVVIVPTVPTGFTINPTSLTFTSGNWNTPQNLTVTLSNPANTNYQTSYITHSITSDDSNYSSHTPVNTSITLINVNTSGGGGSTTSGLTGGSSGSSSSNTTTNNQTTTNTTNNPVVPPAPVTPTTPTVPVVQPVTPVTTPQVIKPIVITPDMPKAWQNIITDGDTVFSITQKPEQTVSPVIQSIITKVLPTNSSVPETTKAQVTTFITQGTNTTKTLGTGERAGVVSSFISAYNKLPSTQTDWQDVIKLANGRWPEQKSVVSENKAKETFVTIYKRQPNSTSSYDNNAITIMAYGLRPVSRNLNSEKNAINTFKSLNNRLPSSASDWDAIRAIAYSGAKR
jgi:hypothetical protein